MAASAIGANCHSNPLQGGCLSQPEHERVRRTELRTVVSANVDLPEPAQPLIDWNFELKEERTISLSRTMGTVTMPERFIGRRTELRKYKQGLINRKLKRLLITGPGGQGKTALAAKLAFDIQARGHKVFAGSACQENSLVAVRIRNGNVAEGRICQKV